MRVFLIILLSLIAFPITRQSDHSISIDPMNLAEASFFDLYTTLFIVMGAILIYTIISLIQITSTKTEIKVNNKVYSLEI